MGSRSGPSPAMRSANVRSASTSRPRWSSSLRSVYGGSCGHGHAARAEDHAGRVAPATWSGSRWAGRASPPGPAALAVQRDLVRGGDAGPQARDVDQRVVVAGDVERALAAAHDLDLARRIGLHPHGRLVRADVAQDGAEDELRHRGGSVPARGDGRSGPPPRLAVAPGQPGRGDGHGRQSEGERQTAPGDPDAAPTPGAPGVRGERAPHREAAARGATAEGARACHGGVLPRTWATAQDARVVRAPDGDAGGVEVLEQRLGELPRGAEVVAQLGERDGALGADERLDADADGGERLGVRPPVAADADRAAGVAEGVEVLGLGAEVGAQRRLVAGAPQALLERQRGGGQRRAAAGGARERRRGTRPGRARRRLRAPAPRAAAPRSRASTSGRRPCRRAAASRTTPPPRVSGGDTTGRRRGRPLAAAAGARAAAARARRRGRRAGRAPRACRGGRGRARRHGPRSASAASTRSVGATAAGGGQDVPAADVVALDAREVRATRCPAAARSTGSSWTCTPRTRARRPPGWSSSTSPRADRARPQRPRDDGPGAADGEGPVDVQQRGAAAPVAGAARRRRGRPGRGALERGADSSTPVPRARRARDGLQRAGRRRAAPRPRARPRRVGQVGLRERDDALADAERPRARRRARRSGA